MVNFEPLVKWGWDRYFASQWEDLNPGVEFVLGRVIRQDRGLYRCVIPRGEGTSVVSAGLEGKYLTFCSDRGIFPGVGDWVVVIPLEEDRGIISSLLERKTGILRLNPGKETLPQTLAANIDLVFIVMALDGGRNFLLPLLERCITVVYESGAKPVIILNKTDLAEPGDAKKAKVQAESAAYGIEVLPVSARTGEGMEKVISLIEPGKTVCFLGKSGVGKTALINYLGRSEGMENLGNEGSTSAKESKGRHTTVRRELYNLPGGGLIIDLPGLKELGLWVEESSVEETYPEIATLASSCRFRDCTHTGEPGCAVWEALGEGRLDKRRYESYLSLRRELSFLARKQDVRAKQEEAKKWKQITREMRHFNKENRI